MQDPVRVQETSLPLVVGHQSWSVEDTEKSKSELTEIQLTITRVPASLTAGRLPDVAIRVLQSWNLLETVA